ncbi:MAG: FMN-binding negative transcriptional regulator [Actinobacteria bacterium]|nr:FMN-binding negative transcriptional regulator [Actinomycetota bacterium]
MYTPVHFRIEDLDECLDIVEQRAFATLVISVDDALEATPIPWVVRRGPLGSARLLGHVSKANPMARLADETSALVIVDLVDGYVSPSWYPSKAEHGRVVPTWNYVSVHLHGEVRCVTDEHWVRDQVRRLTDRHEATNAEPWSMDDAPADFIDTMLRGIVGLEFLVERAEGKAKLSQNRSATDVAGVVRWLQAVPGADALVYEMVQRSMVEEEP